MPTAPLGLVAIAMRAPLGLWNIFEPTRTIQAALAFAATFLAGESVPQHVMKKTISTTWTVAEQLCKYYIDDDGESGFR